MKSAVVAGHVCIDVIPRIDRAFDLTPGRLYEIGSSVMATGGPVSNTGVAMHILGVPTTLMGKIGDDDFGQAVLNLFNARAAELTAGMRVTPGEVTSYTIVLDIPGRDRSFLHCPGANHTFRAADVAFGKVADAALFHFGYPPLMRATYADGGAELVDIYDRVKQLGVTTSLDMAMPDPNGPSGRADWRGILERVLPHVDIFLPSADELLYMIDRDKYGGGDDLDGAELSVIGERLLQLGVAVAGVKLGARGLYLRTAAAARLRAMGTAAPTNIHTWADRELWFPVYRVPRLVGSTGAGDTTIAGFLAAFLRDMRIEDAGALANRVGYFNVQAPDALGGLRDWTTTVASMQEAVTVPLRPPAGWCADAATGQLHGPADQR